MLDTKVDRELDRLQLGVDGKACVLKGHIALVVDIFLHAGNALIVDIDMAGDKAGGRTARIEASLFGPKADPGNAEIEDRLLLTGRQLAAQPDETGLGGQAAIEPFRIEIRKNRQKQFACLVGINDAARLGEEGCRANVCRQDFPVAIDEIGTRGHDPVAGRDAEGRVRLSRAPLDEPAGDRRIDAEEQADRNEEPVLVAGGRGQARRRGGCARLPSRFCGSATQIRLGKSHQRTIAVVLEASSSLSPAPSRTGATAGAGNPSGSTICSGFKGSSCNSA